KLGAGLILIIGTVLMPPHQIAWFVSVLMILLIVLIASRLRLIFFLKRLLLLSPFVLGVALVNAWQPQNHVQWQMVALKSSLCLATVILISNTTPFSKILGVLQRVRVPALLITTLMLMHRYLFVLAEESERMRRARLSRTFTRGGRFQWRSLATVLGQLFVRASERAERIYDAMCSRGWK
ncbi:MAG TPA: energy-coupling factor transporter transmembrane component T, partial [Verrucomicrobiae bacterium]